MKFRCPYCFKLVDGVGLSLDNPIVKAMPAVLRVIGKKKAPVRCCKTCYQRMLKPYRILLPKSGDSVRAIRLPSRILGDIGVRTEGLFAIDPIPAGTAIPYPGKVIHVDSLSSFKDDSGKMLSSEYAKALDADNVLFGQFATAHELHCAHYINSGLGLRDSAVNCQWGTVNVDSSFRRQYSELWREVSTLNVVKYPCLRVSRPVQPGEELIVKTYGSQYWRRVRSERETSDGSVIFTRSLNKSLQRSLGMRGSVAQSSRKAPRRSRKL